MVREGFPPVRCEYVFHAGRKYRFDLAWPELFLAVEVEGGIFTKGGKRCPTCGQFRRGAHGSISGILRDIAKYNLAQIDGWTVLRVTPGMVSSGKALGVVGSWFAVDGWKKAGPKWVRGGSNCL